MTRRSNMLGVPIAAGIFWGVTFAAVGSGKLIALEHEHGRVLKEITSVRCSPARRVSRGRVYVGAGNTQWIATDSEAYFPKSTTGILCSFGVPGEDEVDRPGRGRRAPDRNHGFPP